MTRWETLWAALPTAPDWQISWEAFRTPELSSFIDALSKTPQNPQRHREGDVWAHTKMVCLALVQDRDYRRLPERQQKILFLAALFHDFGKISCTIFETGTWKSPRHTSAGAQMVRHLLWTAYGLCGSREAQQIRECICALIRFHNAPLHLLENRDPERKLLELAAYGENIPDFSLHLLKLLVQADLKGRIGEDADALLENAQLAFLMAEELDVLHKPYPFSSAGTKRAYLSGRNVWRDQELFDDIWGEVILLCGLPGTGKDTYIRCNHPELPVISLDEIRKELDISPKAAQQEVIKTARERARKLLKDHIPFIWNATSLTGNLRRNQIGLFEQYHASVRILYLETGEETRRQRNQGREAAVPETVGDGMLQKLEPPAPGEAHHVQWLLI